jgi:hypothetical protein
MVQGRRRDGTRGDFGQERGNGVPRRGKMVYMARNTKDGKVYIGQTRNLDRRKRVHKTRARQGEPGPFFDAIREFGFDSFEWLILSDAMEPNEMSRHEHEFIRAFNADDPRYGYNVNLPRFEVTEKEAGEAVALAFSTVFGA